MTSAVPAEAHLRSVTPHQMGARRGLAEGHRCGTLAVGVTRPSVPTTRPRHVVTESEAVARALDAAARRWPEDRDNRARLLLHLLEEGHRALAEGQERGNQAYREAVARTSGVLTGLYGEGYLDALREDWPT